MPYDPFGINTVLPDFWANRRRDTCTLLQRHEVFRRWLFKIRPRGSFGLDPDFETYMMDAKKL